MNVANIDRTQDEIVARIEAVKGDDMFGAETGHLVYALDYEHAKPYIKEGVTADEWATGIVRDRDAIVGEMREYMSFAWGKAIDQRGLSANRSINHFSGMLWLLGDDELIEFIEGDNYAQYGKPILRAISKKYGFDVPYTDERADRWAESPDA